MIDAMDYQTLKILHPVIVAISVTGFALRAGGGFASASWTRAPVVRRLPHLVDTLLLASGVALAWRWGSAIFGQPWFLAKMLGLVTYIVLGMVALKESVPLRQRFLAFAAALASVGWMASTAMLKTPLGLFAT